MVIEKPHIKNLFCRIRVVKHYFEICAENLPKMLKIKQSLRRISIRELPLFESLSDQVLEGWRRCTQGWSFQKIWCPLSYLYLLTRVGRGIEIIETYLDRLHRVTEHLWLSSLSIHGINTWMTASIQYLALMHRSSTFILIH